VKSLEIARGDCFARNIGIWRASEAFARVDEDPISGEFGRSYYPAVFGATRTDESFSVTENDAPLLIAICSTGEGMLDYYGMPIRLFLRSGIAERDAQRATAAAFAHMDALAAERDVRSITVYDDASLGTMSAIGKQCLNRRATASLHLSGRCALTDGEVGMKQGLRKSFQSLINWGKRNLTIQSVDCRNPDRELFARYRDFHAVVAGRVTRPDDSWNAMFDWITAGHGELVLGFLSGGELVAGTLVIDGTALAYYASGVYDRNRFDLPLGHWLLWLAMQHAMQRGLRVFELGDLPLPGTVSEKEFSIGYFKRGFATSIETSITWSWAA